VAYGEMRNVNKIFVEKPEGKVILGNQGRYGSIIMIVK
jgi:hypothetical protein